MLYILCSQSFPVSIVLRKLFAFKGWVPLLGRGRGRGRGTKLGYLNNFSNIRDTA
jgi:hypothetical protein